MRIGFILFFEKTDKQKKIQLISETPTLPHTEDVLKELMVVELRISVFSPGDQSKDILPTLPKIYVLLIFVG